MPSKRQPLDRLEMDLIRRVNLDVFWSHRSSHVRNMCRDFNQLKRLTDQLKVEPSQAIMGPWPVGDPVAFDVAISMLWKSLLPGVNAKDHQQYSTIRKLRTVSRAVYESSFSGFVDSWSFTDKKGLSYDLTRNPTQSKFFRMFIAGCERRMGHLIIQNVGLDISLLLAIIQNLEREFWGNETSNERRRFVVMSACCFIAGFAAALRGGEILLTEASDLCKMIDYGRSHVTKYVLLPLKGEFKNEVGERNVLCALVGTTSSGIPVRTWFERWVLILRSEGKDKQGLAPAFCHKNGFVIQEKLFDIELHRQLGSIQKKGHLKIPSGVDIEKFYHIFRSLRRGGTTRAINLGLSKSIIDTNNRWRTLQNATRGKAALGMDQLYLEITTALDTRLAFSKAL